jgi:uncharacterized protein
MGTPRLTAAISALLLLCGAPASAQTGRLTDDDLYRAETIVTGQGEPERLRGFRVGTEEAVVKLTGDATLLGSERIAPVIDRSAELVQDFTYEDRMKGIPVHDEQGTRDRPHYLRIRFDKAKFDAAMAEAKLKKWQGGRPLLALWLGIKDARSATLLSADGPEGYGQREVLKDISKKRGVPIVLPPAGASAVSYHTIAGGDAGALRQEAGKLGADGLLFGTLDFDGDVAWNTRWTVSGKGVEATWSMKGVTFDTALKAAIERSAAEFAKTAGKVAH